jgi:hypothetical protein
MPKMSSNLDGATHPALMSMIQYSKDGTFANAQTARTEIGKTRFSIYAKNLING